MDTTRMHGEEILTQYHVGQTVWVLEGHEFKADFGFEIFEAVAHVVTDIFTHTRQDGTTTVNYMLSGSARRWQPQSVYGLQESAEKAARRYNKEAPPCAE